MMQQPKHSKMMQMSELSQASESEMLISAWMDGDDETSLPEGLLTPTGHETWQMYHLIGDALRTPGLAIPVHSAFQQRVASALAAEPPMIAAPRPKPAAVNKPSRRYVWSGLAMAAAVASVGWVARPLFFPDATAPAAQVAIADPAAIDAPAMRDYVSAHRQVAGPAAVRQVSFGAGR